MAQQVTIKKAQDQIGKKVDDFIEDVAIDLSNELKREAPVHSGRLRNSIQVQKNCQGEYNVNINAEYASDLIDPEPREVDFQPIFKWVQRKLNMSGSSAYAFANYTVNKIEDEGVNKNDFVKRAVDNIKEEY